MSIHSDELATRLRRTLQQRAMQHPDQATVLAHVRRATTPRPIIWTHYAAMAAMLAVFVVLPAPLTPSVPDPLAAQSPLLTSPQSVEDLEMLHMFDDHALDTP